MSEDARETPEVDRLEPLPVDDHEHVGQLGVLWEREGR